MTVYSKPDGDPWSFEPQDDAFGRKSAWEEDGYTVFRSNARTGPGCHNNCGVLLYVKDGILEKVEGDPENPYNKGRLCPRCLAAREVVYHKDRLLYPMKRAGARGENKWERITWDEAYDTIEKKFKDVIAKDGPEAISVTTGTGRDVIGYASRLSYTLGTPNHGSWFAGTSCYVPRLFMVNQKMGHFVVADCSQFFPGRYDNPEYRIPEYIVIWGNNPVYSNSDGFLGHWIVELMKRGTRLITIDPRLTWLAAKSEYFLQLRPGTDAALALAIGNVICEEEIYDHEFVGKWTDGFEAYRERAREYPPEKAAEICGIAPSLIRGAARAVAKAGAASLQWGVSVDQVAEPIYTGAAILDIFALTGNIEKPGSMVVATPAFGVRNPWLGGWGAELLSQEQKDKRLNSRFPYARSVNMANTEMVRESMLYGRPYQIKACWIQSSNPLSNSAQDPLGALEALRKMDFNVVVDLFMTPTALAAADIVLPAATFAERDGLCGHQPYYLGAVSKAIEPLGECRTDQRIVYEISSRFNKEANPWKTDIELYDSLLEPVGIEYEDIRERTWAYPPFEYYRHEKAKLRPDKKPGFNTISGKYEFCNRHLEKLGLDPLPSYCEPFYSHASRPELAAKYPLVLITGARRPGYFLSEHRQIPSLRRLNPEPMVAIHNETAAKYGIGDGDWVWLENDYGKTKMKAELTLAVRRDVVSADNGWWFPERDPGDGSFFGTFESNINTLLTLQTGMMGTGSMIRSSLCKISRIEESGT